MSKNSRRRQQSDRQVETWQFQDEATNKVLVTVRFYRDGMPEITFDPNIRPVQREIAASRFLDVRPDLTHDGAWNFLFG